LRVLNDQLDDHDNTISDITDRLNI
jgi:hypothetical protein